jgi:Na+/H+-dicarboxylate symporter
MEAWCHACRTGRITTWSLLYYLLSMVLAVVLGIALSYIIRPGRSQPFASRSAQCSGAASATAAAA